MKATFYEAGGVDMLRLQVDDQNAIVRAATDDDKAKYIGPWADYEAERDDAHAQAATEALAKAAMMRDAAKAAKRERRATAIEKQERQEAEANE